MNKIKELYSYLKKYGSKETLFRICKYINFKSKTIFTIFGNGVYRMSTYEKKSVVFKDKKIFVFSKSSYYDKDDNYYLNKLVEKFNRLGFGINYFYIHKKSKRKHIDLPLATHKLLKKSKINVQLKNIDSNDILLFEYFSADMIEFLDYAKEKKCKIIYSDVLKENISDDFLSKVDLVISPYKSIDRYNNIKNIKLLSNYLNDSEYDICTKILNYLFVDNRVCDNEFFNNISIIVLNYNNKNVIRHCIDTLDKYSQKYKYEIIVVDNQSNDGSYELLKEKYKNIKLVQNVKNGCSSGRNLGVSVSSKDFIVFLDSDQWILYDGWLDNYINIIKKNPNIGAIGWTGGWFNKKGYSHHVVDSFRYRYMMPMGLFRCDIGYIGTGGFMIKKELFNKIEGFDEYYDPTCYEDTDISLKVRNLGFDIAYCPYLGIGHLPHQTTKSGSKEHEQLIRNKGDYFVKKWQKLNPQLLKLRK